MFDDTLRPLSKGRFTRSAFLKGCVDLVHPVVVVQDVHAEEHRPAFHARLPRGRAASRYADALEDGSDSSGRVPRGLAQRRGKWSTSHNRADPRQDQRHRRQDKAAELAQAPGRPRILDLDTWSPAHLSGKHTFFIVTVRHNRKMLGLHTKAPHPVRRDGSRYGIVKQRNDKGMRHDRPSVQQIERGGEDSASSLIKPVRSRRVSPAL